MSNANDPLTAAELKKILDICLRNLYDQFDRIQPQLWNLANVSERRRKKLKKIKVEMKNIEDLIIKTSCALRSLKKKEGRLPQHGRMKIALELLDVIDLIDKLLQVCGDKINKLNQEQLTWVIRYKPDSAFILTNVSLDRF